LIYVKVHCCQYWKFNSQVCNIPPGNAAEYAG
jgi:hypothetical protein